MGSAARRIGLLGGSFNPAHGGHRHISLMARKALGLDEVWWLVSPGNPLKETEGQAPLAARLGSALQQARGARIRVTAVETEFATRYTVDSLQRIVARWPKRRFIWLMGADNLAQFHRWRDWRRLARIMPIAVIARPGYSPVPLASPARVWLARFPQSSVAWLHKGPYKRHYRARWSTPSLVSLTLKTDPRSATACRLADPLWADSWHARYGSASAQFDNVTHRPLFSAFAASENRAPGKESILPA